MFTVYDPLFYRSRSVRFDQRLKDYSLPPVLGQWKGRHRRRADIDRVSGRVMWRFIIKTSFGAVRGDAVGSSEIERIGRGTVYAPSIGSTKM
jgi:hypothetical protein